MSVFRITFENGQTVSVRGSHLTSCSKDFGGFTYIQDDDGHAVFHGKSDQILSVIDTSAQRQTDQYEMIDTFSKNVFIVHGHDDATKYELKDFLSSLGLTPFVLHQLDDKGLTIIEKFEHYASQCSFAFVLLTPDEPPPGVDEKENRWRSRPNVIMELGWFLARLGRGRVVLLHKGSVEIPSDIHGVLYLRFEKSVIEVSEMIRRRLTGAGVLE